MCSRTLRCGIRLHLKRELHLGQCRAHALQSSRSVGGFMRRAFQVALITVALTSVTAGLATAQVKDTWLTAKTKIALMTTEDLHTKSLNVDTVDGVVTLHGTVPTETEKERAAQVAKGIDGVKSVKNVLQVVPRSEEKAVDAKDDA